MSDFPSMAWVIVEQVGGSIVSVRIRQTEEAAIDAAMKIIASNETDPKILAEAQVALDSDWLWTDGQGWIVSVTDAEAE